MNGGNSQHDLGKKGQWLAGNVQNANVATHSQKMIEAMDGLENIAVIVIMLAVIGFNIRKNPL